MPNSQKERNESPILCIFFCEFDPLYGPKITYQVRLQINQLCTQLT